MNTDNPQSKDAPFVAPTHGGAYDEDGTLLHRTTPAGPEGPKD
jgi:hypothetical protein